MISYTAQWGTSYSPICSQMLVIAVFRVVWLASPSFLCTCSCCTSIQVVSGRMEMPHVAWSIQLTPVSNADLTLCASLLLHNSNLTLCNSSAHMQMVGYGFKISSSSPWALTHVFNTGKPTLQMPWLEWAVLWNMAKLPCNVKSEDTGISSLLLWLNLGHLLIRHLLIRHYPSYAPHKVCHCVVLAYICSVTYWLAM